MITDNVRNVLDDVFGAPEEQVETFLDVIKDALGQEVQDGMRGAVSGEVVAARQTAQFSAQQSGMVQVQHGWHDDDYVWHIRPASDRRQWKVSTNRVIYAISKVFAAHIPSRVTINIFPPQQMWEIHEITYKAMELKNEWGVSSRDIEKLNQDLFEVLNTLI